MVEAAKKAGAQGELLTPAELRAVAQAVINPPKPAEQVMGNSGSCGIGSRSRLRNACGPSTVTLWNCSGDSNQPVLLACCDPARNALQS